MSWPNVSGPPHGAARRARPQAASC